MEAIKGDRGEQSSNPRESVEQIVEEVEKSLILILPSEVQVKILEYLNAVDVGVLSCVCKELQIMAAGNEELWKKECKNKFGRVMAEDWKRVCVRWKDTFYTLATLDMFHGSFSFLCAGLSRHQ
ncbi:hypothetical protein SUGI_0114740 [Cryptomeria japonica]|nr:hypothetical protein SUGI_0114720 [Cryptomeria japonica]GLJ09723.1 hypothetical protein SUGI_0114740 [Cryptomeria japonica]